MDCALNFLGGSWVASDRPPGVCINPATGEPAAQFSEASAEEARAAVAAARVAFDRGAWPRSPRLRETVLLEFAANLQARAPQIEQLFRSRCRDRTGVDPVTFLTKATGGVALLQ